MDPENETAALQLWYAYPADLLDESAAQACAALLGEEERARAARYRFDRSRREYIATHALARRALAHNHTLAPADWRFTANAYGKPSAHPDCGLRFNLSNAPELVVCLVAHGADAGVDVEPISRAPEIRALAGSVFSQAEQTQLETLTPAGQLNRALSLWVLKESYIKARGMGLSLPLKKFSFLFGPGSACRLELDPNLEDTAERWRFCLIEHAQHRIALMVEKAPRELEIWEASPPQAPPARLSKANPNWFPVGSQSRFPR